jgi:hypothetical protein
MIHDVMNMMGVMAGDGTGLAAARPRARPWGRRPREVRVFQMTSSIHHRGVTHGAGFSPKARCFHFNHN